MGASGNLLLSAAAGLLLIACATATATTNEGSVGGAIAEEKDASSALFFRLTYETPPFLSHSTAAARADFRRLWETGVNTLSKKRFEAAVKAWVLSQQDPKLQV
jgi:hypothetical protein